MILNFLYQCYVAYSLIIMMLPITFDMSCLLPFACSFSMLCFVSDDDINMSRSHCMKSFERKNLRIPWGVPLRNAVYAITS